MFNNNNINFGPLLSQRFTNSLVEVKQNRSGKRTSRFSRWF